MMNEDLRFLNGRIYTSTILNRQSSFVIFYFAVMFNTQNFTRLSTENLLAAAPPFTIASFYRTSAGAEVDLILEIPGHGLSMRAEGGRRAGDGVQPAPRSFWPLR